MTLLTNSEAEKAAQQEKYKIEEVKTQLDYSKQSLDALISLYTNNKTRVNELKNNGRGVGSGPWKNLSSNLPITNEPGLLGPIKDQDHIFNYIFEQPMSLVYNNPDPVLKSTLPLTINKIKPQDYSNIFSDAEIKGIFNIKVSLTQALTSLDGLNITKFQEALTNIKRTLTEELFEDVEVFRDIVDVINTEIINPQSLIYKAEKAYGPYSVSQINLFRLPPELLEIRNSCNNILGEIRNLFTILDKILNIPEDIIARAALTNAGLTQSSTDPNVFNAPVTEEKDPWGIRFSYNKSINAQTFIQENSLSSSRSNNTLTTTPENTDTPNSFIETNNGLLNNIVSSKRDFYFQLLPAIKSNLPVSGGSDVPGAMPGIQFRIENNIVKHKIPGFSPVYQPMGIDSIKCTLVGMFTGYDGVDISASYSNDINAGLLAPDKDFTSLFNSQINTNPTSTSSTNLDSSSGLPIPASSRSNTASNVAVLSEDAFRGAQDFYNEVVATGREIEVELNLRKSSLPCPAGTTGPFRDAETGNPKFKGLIKRLDLYYVRRDRCWFILDLEITDAGLIGKECINLTNIIEEATELFEAVEEIPTGLTKEELDFCFKHNKPGGNTVTYQYKGEKSALNLVVDLNTGLSYDYVRENNTLVTGEIFPRSTRDTVNLLGKQYKNLKGNLNKNGNALRNIVTIFINATAEIKTNPSDTTPVYFQNKVKINTASIIGNVTAALGNPIAVKDRYALYDKNSGIFYAVNAKKELRDVKTKVLSNRYSKLGTLKDIQNAIDTDYLTFDGKTQESIDFFINEYINLITFKANSCDKTLKDKKEAEVTKISQQENKTTELENSLNSVPNSTQETLKETDFFKNTQTNKEEDKQTSEEQLNQIKSSIEEGNLDILIQNALTEYINILYTGATSSFSLSSELTKELLSQKQANNLLITQVSNKPITITIKNKSASLDTIQSNSQELFIEIAYNTSESFLLEHLNKESSKISTFIDKNSLNKTADLILKSYTDSTNTIVYKVDGVVITPN